MKQIEIDKNKNKLVIKEDVVKLSLASERENGHRRWRKIGKILTLPHNIIVYQKYEDSIFRKFKAFGFCHKAIEIINPDYVRVIYRGKEAKEGGYSIPTDIFRKEAKFLNFKKQGFELRCYVPIEKFYYVRRK